MNEPEAIDKKSDQAKAFDVSSLTQMELLNCKSDQEIALCFFYVLDTISIFLMLQAQSIKQNCDSSQALEKFSRCMAFVERNYNRDSRKPKMATESSCACNSHSVGICESVLICQLCLIDR